MSTDTQKFYCEQLSPLVGGKVVGLAVSPSGEDEYNDGFVGLVVEKAGDKKVVWFLRDDEGNGPGSFEIEGVN